MFHRTYLRVAAASLALLALTSCNSAPDTSNPAIEDNDKALGAEQHPQLLAEFGGAYPGPQSAYVAQLGDGLAQKAGLGGQCQFTLVNSDVVNAFAVPGCYIYVTRGLLSIVNSEAELASVMSHELGHILANHSGRQQNRSLIGQLSVFAIALITGSDRLTQMAGKAATFFTLRYSRSQEYEADDLGLKTMIAAGYDPYEEAEMLSALSRQERFLALTRGSDPARSMPEWARTHPLTDNRIKRAVRAAEATGDSNGTDKEFADRYLSALDGMLFGDDPEQGFVIGRRFAHPIMRIGFEAPEGFTLTNSPQAILLEGPDGIRGEFGGGAARGLSLASYVEALIAQIVKQSPAKVGPARAGVVNGIETIVVPVSVTAQQGTAELRIAAYAGADGAVYHFIIAQGSKPAPQALDALFASFHLLDDAQVRTLRARVIDVSTAASGATVESEARTMASDNRVAQFLMLNALEPGQPLDPGQRVKLIRYVAE